MIIDVNHQLDNYENQFDEQDDLFNDLPPEIIQKIFSYLSFGECTVIKAVCKNWMENVNELEKVVFRCFANTLGLDANDDSEAISDILNSLNKVGVNESDVDKFRKKTLRNLILRLAHQKVSPRKIIKAKDLYVAMIRAEQLWKCVNVRLNNKYFHEILFVKHLSDKVSELANKPKHKEFLSSIHELTLSAGASTSAITKFTVNLFNLKTYICKKFIDSDKKTFNRIGKEFKSVLESNVETVLDALRPLPLNRDQLFGFTDRMNRTLRVAGNPFYEACFEEHFMGLPEEQKSLAFAINKELFGSRYWYDTNVNFCEHFENAPAEFGKGQKIDYALKEYNRKVTLFNLNITTFSRRYEYIIEPDRILTKLFNELIDVRTDKYKIRALIIGSTRLLINSVYPHIDVQFNPIENLLQPIINLQSCQSLGNNNYNNNNNNIEEVSEPPTKKHCSIDVRKFYDAE